MLFLGHIVPFVNKFPIYWMLTYIEVGKAMHCFEETEEYKQCLQDDNLLLVQGFLVHLSYYLFLKHIYCLTLLLYICSWDNWFKNYGISLAAYCHYPLLVLVYRKLIEKKVVDEVHLMAKAKLLELLAFLLNIKN